MTTRWGILILSFLLLPIHVGDIANMRSISPFYDPFSHFPLLICQSLTFDLLVLTCVMSPSLWTLWWWTSSASVGNLDSAVTKYWGNHIDDDVDESYIDEEDFNNDDNNDGKTISHERPPGPAVSDSGRLDPQTWWSIVIVMFVIIFFYDDETLVSTKCTWPKSK